MGPFEKRENDGQNGRNEQHVKNKRMISGQKFPRKVFRTISVSISRCLFRNPNTKRSHSAIRTASLHLRRQSQRPTMHRNRPTRTKTAITTPLNFSSWQYTSAALGPPAEVQVSAVGVEAASPSSSSSLRSRSTQSLQVVVGHEDVVTVRQSASGAPASTL